MRLRHIEVFHAIYTTGSVTNAAKLLHVSQPAVSKVLSHAEQQLGFKLFNRVKGRLEPTSEAVLLFTETDQLYQQLDTINLIVEGIRNRDIGRISLAITPALGFDVLSKEIALFRTKYPNIAFDIQTIHHDQIHAHLFKRKSEIAIMFAPETFSGIKEIMFGYGKAVVVYPKSLLPDTPSELSLSDIVKLPFVSIWDSGPLANLILHEMKKQNITPPSGLKVQTYFTAVNLVKYGAGVCIVDEFTAHSLLSPDIAIATLTNQIEFPIKGLHLDTTPPSHVLNEFLSSFNPL